MEIASTIVEYLAVAVDPLIMIYVFSRMYDERNRTRSYMINVLFFLCMFGLGFINVQYEILQTLMVVIIVSVYMGINYHGRFLVKVLYVFAFLIIMTFVNVCAIQLVSIASGESIQQCVTFGQMVRIPVLFISKFLLLFVMQVFVGRIFQCRIDRQEMMLMIAIFICTFFATFIMAYVMIRGELSEKMDVLLTICMFCCLLINVVTYIILGRINKYRTAKERADMITVQMKQQQKMFLRLDEVYQQTKAMKHDLKHYFSLVLGLMKEGSYDKAEAKIEEIIGKKMQNEFIRYVGNDVVNAVINDKQLMCQQNDIVFAVEINGEISKERELEVAVLLSNLLDNAIEAELKEEQKRIGLLISQNKGMFLIEVKNYISKSVLADNPHLRTSKEKKKEHGIGLASVREITEKLDGWFQIQEEGQEFITSVTFSDQVEMAE